ncbi:putative MFS family arabinose efflux permease [Actinoplanes octamycinicus]|uniref:Putative MFS family arabinose efflux permease n=1 Tax=Actinoplanes octamycinicus TaxID=135948 RepID=A0A7W7MD30_9ACTN|nr:MFS transporter [Actinoplanes octamycinicus]MBB4745774.1 putative MFS family arabinose efflux permease [Actinoplanes octamycinicus]
MRPRGRLLGPVLVLAMALPTSVLYSVGAVGAQITATFGLSRAALGALPAAVFGTAAVLSLWSGGLVDRIGARAALLGLFGVATAAFLLMGSATGYPGLIAAMVLSGVGQALSNPATNLAITENLAPAERAGAVGRKQAGVQLSALVVGLAAPLLTGLAGWRAVLLAGAPLALAALAGTVLRIPARPAPPPAFSWRPARPNRFLALLMVFLAVLGCGVSAVATFATLYGQERLHQPPGTSAALIAALGLAGVASRLLWSRHAATLVLLSPLLRRLAAGAAGSAALIWAAAGLGPVALWAGTIGVGATAVGANAVTMVLIVRDRRCGPLGPSSALLSLGFFAGFVAGPIPLGAIADTFGYGPAWLTVAALFLLAAVLAARVLRHERRTPPRPPHPPRPQPQPAQPQPAVAGVGWASGVSRER